MTHTRRYFAKSNDLLVQYPSEHGAQFFYVKTCATDQAAEREAVKANQRWAEFE